jgi:hypothetical protein
MVVLLMLLLMTGVMLELFAAAAVKENNVFPLGP